MKRPSAAEKENDDGKHVAVDVAVVKSSHVGPIVEAKPANEADDISDTLTHAKSVRLDVKTDPKAKAKTNASFFGYATTQVSTTVPQSPCATKRAKTENIHT